MHAHDAGLDPLLEEIASAKKLSLRQANDLLGRAADVAVALIRDAERASEYQRVVKLSESIQEAYLTAADRVDDAQSASAFAAGSTYWAMKAEYARLDVDRLERERQRSVELPEARPQMATSFPAKGRQRPVRAYVEPDQAQTGLPVSPTSVKRAEGLASKNSAWQRKLPTRAVGQPIPRAVQTTSLFSVGRKLLRPRTSETEDLDVNGPTRVMGPIRKDPES